MRFESLENFDRRWIFAVMGIAIMVGVLVPMGLPTKPSPPVKAIYYTIEALPEGATVILSVDLDPASTPELEPFFRSVVLQLKRKKAKLIFLTTWYQAPPLVERWLRETMGNKVDDTDVVYRKNVDYIWLGFREGKEALIANLGQDIWSAYGGKAADGSPLSKYPIMKNVRRLSDADLIVLLSAGYPGGKEYVQQVQSRYKLRMVAACTAVSTTDLAPYYYAGQLLGLAGGMSATAEYEQLVGYPNGLGAKGLDVLNIGHVVVVLAILFGNFIYFYGRYRRRGKR